MACPKAPFVSVSGYWELPFHSAWARRGPPGDRSDPVFAFGRESSPKFLPSHPWPGSVNRSNLSLCELRQFGFGSSPVETGRFGRPPCDGSAVDSSGRQGLGHSAGALHNALNSQSFGCAEHCFWWHFFFLEWLKM